MKRKVGSRLYQVAIEGQDGVTKRHQNQLRRRPLSLQPLPTVVIAPTQPSTQVVPTEVPIQKVVPKPSSLAASRPRREIHPPKRYDPCQN